MKTSEMSSKLLYSEKIVVFSLIKESQSKRNSNCLNYYFKITSLF